MNIVVCYSTDVTTFPLKIDPILYSSTSKDDLTKLNATLHREERGSYIGLGGTNFIPTVCPGRDLLTITATIKNYYTPTLIGQHLSVDFPYLCPGEGKLWGSTLIRELLD